jgi:transposase
MEGMVCYSKAAMERTMKVQEVLLRAMARKITWFQAAEILGLSDRHLRRIRERYEEFGYDGLWDRRRGQPSRKRVPLVTVEAVLGLYRERYFDLNVSHFHEQWKTEHQIDLSYTWVKAALQGAGLVARASKRGVHRRRRERRPLPGMLLHIDGSRHQWFQDERWYDLIVILDDATSEIYYAQLTEEESSLTVLAGLKEVIERKGVFCALYSDRGSHFWLTPKAGGKVDPHRLTQVGRALRELGVQMIPALFAPGARAERAQLWYLARTVAAGTTAARNQSLGGGQSFPARALHGRVQCSLSGPGDPAWQCIRAPLQPRSRSDFRPAVRTQREPRQHGQHPEPAPAD